MNSKWVSSIVKDLNRERGRLESELHRVSAALSAFGTAYIKGTKPPAAKRRRPKISAAGRKRIAAAQRARWAKVRAAAKK